MTTDIYGKSTQYRATDFVTADTMTMKFGGGVDQLAAGEYLVQNVAIQYANPKNRIYEIGTSYVYFAPTRSIGSCQIGRIIGRKPIIALLGQPGHGMWTTDFCTGNEQERTIIFLRRQPINPPPTSSGAIVLAYTLTGCVVESYGISTNANGVLVTENVTLQFAGLDISFQ